MALFQSRQVLVCISVVFCVIFHTELVSSAPSSSGIQDDPVPDELHNNLIKSSEPSPVHLKQEDLRHNSESSRTLESIMSMMGSLNIFSNMANLFGTQGTRYEWVPLGSLIFSNRLGQGTNQKAAS